MKLLLDNAAKHIEDKCRVSETIFYSDSRYWIEWLLTLILSHKYKGCVFSIHSCKNDKPTNVSQLHYQLYLVVPKDVGPKTAQIACEEQILSNNRH